MPARKPWSLVRRLTGGVVAVALLAFVMQVVVMGFWIRPVASDVATTASEQAQQVRAALAAVPPAARAALAARLSVGQAVVSATEPPPSALSAPPNPRLPPELESHVRELALRGIAVRVQPVEPKGFRLVFRLPVDSEVWWLQRTAQGPAAAMSNTLWVWLAMLSLATAGALFVSVRFIARPLARLAAQLQHQPAVLRPLSAGPNPSAELQALVAAFNGLVQQVTQAAQNRQQLLAGVSHDLRTPLARLRLRVETQCEPPVAEPLTADLHALERIVDQFLAYVQNDAATVPLGEPAPLDASVREAVVRQAALGQPAVVELDNVERPAAGYPALPDLAIHRLLTNLIDNAYAHGAGPVRVTLARIVGGAELRVHDSGPGMSAEEFERARQPFVRLGPARAELGHCGLGLAIVSQLVRQLGAQLHARRPPGGGFEVVVTLPG